LDVQYWIELAGKKKKQKNKKKKQNKKKKKTKPNVAKITTLPLG
jgi:hypothetical protein